MAEVRVHPEAQGEYDRAFAWYFGQSPQAADRFEAEAERILNQILAAPSMFPLYDDGHRFASLHRFPYILVYRVFEDDVHVIAVAHKRRRPGYWRDRA